jgi:hypothetical protein
MVVSVLVRANVIQAKQNAPVSHARSVRVEKRRIATRDQVLQFLSSNLVLHTRKGK